MAEEVTASGPVVPLPKEGDVIAGKFRVERVLAVGGMGVVFAAQHMIMGQRVAVKMLLPDALAVPSAVERFHREAQAAANIRNEHVVRIMDVGHTDTGAPYIVMEYLVGSDLGELIERRKNIPIEEAVDYLLQACEAMADAHRIGIVHRDLKPGNVFLTRRSDNTPLIKVLDFGISKIGEEIMGQKQWQLTRTHVMMGSPLYMSPEQIRNAKTVDRRSDIWSLGIILFELLTGQLPFDGETAISICAQVAADPPIPLRLLHPEMPEALEDVILRCLEKEPEHRYDDVAALAEALAPFGSESARTSAARARRTLADESRMPTLNAARIKPEIRKQTPRPMAKTDPSWQKKAAAEAGIPPKRSGFTRTVLSLAFVGILGAGAWVMRDRLMSVARENDLLPDPETVKSAASSSEQVVKEVEKAIANAIPTTGESVSADSGTTTSGGRVESVPAGNLATDAGVDAAAADAGDAGDEEEEEEPAVAGRDASASPARPGTAATHRPGTAKPGVKKKKPPVRHK
ncbi:serine/threonine protein kinase [Pendulispora rubella]|uniref:Serine/threonine protein kinase n=1 Tax=Pendulispora rubella TaxID=2741070 RepID=A0ABZ2LIN3_9BACT